jgi:hypothetical protein
MGSTTNNATYALVLTFYFLFIDSGVGNAGFACIIPTWWLNKHVTDRPADINGVKFWSSATGSKNDAIDRIEIIKGERDPTRFKCSKYLKIKDVTPHATSRTSLHSAPQQQFRPEH